MMPVLALAALLVAAPALAASAVAAPAAAAPHPDRLNALALENGAVLTVDGGSYGTGVSDWSSWHLTNGDEATGWCSPQGKPVGAAFTWELDTTWRLDTLVLSTRNLQESGYPGISARLVELWLDSGKGFVRVGSFEIGKQARKEFALPAGTTARQAKIVVAGNHGNADFTEIAEVELYGERTAPVPAPTMAGDFDSNYGPMRFALDGEHVYGCYDWVDGATITGTLVGRNARVTWVEPREDGTLRQGTAIFVVATGGAKLNGVWYEQGALQGVWDGTRLDHRVARCTPRKRAAMDELRQQHHLALYGIRFDSNSDVLRAESDGTLDEVADLLRQTPALRLLVEGHTDATNTDAYNLELSQRRAQAVVAALVKRGILQGRLRAQGFGKSRPVADNASAQGRALNRRVEVSILE